MLFLVVIFSSCQHRGSVVPDNKERNAGLQKLEYNNPELLVDLDAGFKSVPMPMDFDGDGDYDLLVSESAAYVESGIFYFENISGNVEMPVFRRGMKVSYERRRLGDDGGSFQVSEVDGEVHVLTPDRVREKLLVYKNVPQNVFWDSNEIQLTEKGYDFLHFFKKSQWKMIDFDGDGVTDLVCAATSPGLSGLRGAGANERENAYRAFKGKHNQLAFLKNSGTDKNPVYENPVEILKENGESLAKGLEIKPLFADYDNDGDFDYIAIGRPINAADYDVKWKKNFILYFENTGTKSDYKFDVGKVLTYEDIPIRMDSRSAINLTVFDWNKDGAVDLIAGEESGRVSMLRNTGKVVNGVPQFLPPHFFQQEAKYVDFGALTAPRVFDWDGDGLDDIISGNEMGYIGFLKNLGGNNPRWNKPELLKIDGAPIRLIKNEAVPGTEEPIWGYTTIDVGYWDEDDLPDILVNEHNGNIVYLKNVGTREKPELSEPQVLEVEWNGEPQKPEWSPGTAKGNELLAPWRTSPVIMDFNEDGLNDLVVMDYEGYLVVYPRVKKENGDLVLAHPQRSFVFQTGEPVLLNQLKGKSSGRLKITFADWDGDGLKDLIVASKPGVDWMRNIGKKDGKMVLQYMGRVVSRTLMGHSDAPVVADWNKDNVPDLLVGTESGVFYYWERPSIEITTTMTTSGKQTPANYSYFKR